MAWVYNNTNDKEEHKNDNSISNNVSSNDSHEDNDDNNSNYDPMTGHNSCNDDADNGEEDTHKEPSDAPPLDPGMSPKDIHDETPANGEPQQWHWSITTTCQHSHQKHNQRGSHRIALLPHEATESESKHEYEFKQESDTDEERTFEDDRSRRATVNIGEHIKTIPIREAMDWNYEPWTTSSLRVLCHHKQPNFGGRKLDTQHIWDKTPP